MKSSFIREVTLYRYRYIIGYIAFGILLFGLLAFAIEQVPRGLSDAEMQSVRDSAVINPFHPVATNVVDAPYHLLQKLSIYLLGLTPLAMKLPSILLGAITGVTLILMLRRWFRTNVALITALSTVTSVGFLSVARMATPMIMPTFWTVLLLFGAAYMLHSERHRFAWKLFCFTALAFLAYSPYGIYPLIVMAIAGVLHPHVRYRLRQGKLGVVALLGLYTLLLLTPLVIACIYTPHIALQLLGLDTISHINFTQIVSNAWVVIASLFNFTTNHAGVYVTPLFNIATSILLLLGFLKLCTAAYAARSYMLFIWMFALTPILLLHPDAIMLVLVPSALMLAIGIDTLIRQWYDLFPRNPYARIGALIPLGVLVISATTINVSRYFLSYHYNHEASALHAELPAIKHTLIQKKLTKTPVTLVVPTAQLGFYDLLRRQYPQLSVTDHQPDTRKTLIILASSPVTLPHHAQPSYVATNDVATDESLLLRVYTPRGD